MKEFERACKSPEEFVQFVRDNVLAIDPELLEEFGFTIDSTGALKATSKQAKKILPAIRKKLQEGIALLDTNIGDVGTRVNIREREPNLELRAEKALAQDETAFVKELEGIGIPESARQDFITRAREARKKAMQELNAQVSPEELTRQFINELYALLTPVMLQIILSAESREDRKSVANLGKDTQYSLREFINSPTGAAVIFGATSGLIYNARVSGIMGSMDIFGFVAAVASAAGATLSGIKTFSHTYKAPPFSRSFFTKGTLEERKSDFNNALFKLRAMLEEVTAKATKQEGNKQASSQRRKASDSPPLNTPYFFEDRDDENDIPRRDTRQTQ